MTLNENINLISKNDKEKREIIIDNLTTLSLSNLNLLIIEIEKKFNINLSNYLNTTISPTIVSTKENTAELKEKEEKLLYNIILQSIQADKKISVLKVVRTITGFGLKESKDIVDNLPKILKENISKDDCEKIKKEIETAGGSVIFE
jgi:large subunit ribosomal protein L7/L12